MSRVLWLVVGMLWCSSAVAEGPGWPALDSVTGGGTSRDDVALVVAIGNYAGLPLIAGAVENGQAWLRWLARGRGIAADRVTLLVDKQGTRSRILAATQELAKKTRPGGTFWLVFIGHGVTNAQREGVLVGALAVQEEFDLFSQSVTQKELVAAATGRQSATVAVIDACFSGQTSGGDVLLANRGATVLRDLSQKIGGASTT